MKIFIMFFSLVFSANVFAAAATKKYNCTNMTTRGQFTTLEMVGDDIFWNDSQHSVSSRGAARGVETAPFAETFNYLKFKLVTFYQTEDSAYYVALSSKTSPHLKAVLYFDNDDHYEYVQRFNCVRQ